MEHKTSVREYLPAVRHNVRLAEKYERLASHTKNRCRRVRFARKAAGYRRNCARIAKIWGQQCAWNREHWQYLFDKMYGPISPEVHAQVERDLNMYYWRERTEENARKARSYDFWEMQDVVHQETQKGDQHGPSESNHFDGEHP